jgi:hypothetical protein
MTISTTHGRFLTRLLAVALIAVAAAPAAALARPAPDPHAPNVAARHVPSVDPLIGGNLGRWYEWHGKATPATPAAPVFSAPFTSDPKLDWPSAGIGAGIATSIALVALGGFTVSIRRRPRRGALLS